jgi:predicted RNase H-like nuclease (RuvC/YqgF family)
MTKEQIEKLGIKYVEGMTDDQVFEAITKKQGELEAEKNKFESEAKTNKGLVDKYSSEIATYKDKEKQRMTDEEKKQLEYKELQNEIATLKKEKSVSEKTAKYIKLGYAEEVARQVAEGELEGKDVSDLHASFLKSHDEKLKKELMKDNPNIKGGGGNGATYTKEDFKAGRISMEQMNQLKETDPALYNELIK